MSEIWIRIILLVYLSICCYTDIKERYISLIASVLCMLGQFIILMCGGGLYGFGIFGILPGCIFLLTARIHPEIGTGDALMIVTLGFGLGMKILPAIYISLLLTFIYGGIHYCLYKKKYLQGSDGPLEIAFAPFCLAGFLVMIIAD